jgi:hypothetical protein
MRKTKEDKPILSIHSPLFAFFILNNLHFFWSYWSFEVSEYIWTIRYTVVQDLFWNLNHVYMKQGLREKLVPKSDYLY